MATANLSSLQIPNLLFDNRTPFAATQFDMVDQFNSAFHVVVARIGYRLGPCGADGRASLLPTGVAVPLATDDRHLDGNTPGGNTQAGTLQESDFAPYKPRCDVIVNATAHAPRDQALPQFLVNLHLRKNRQTLINKTLQVCGERHFIKKPIATRLAQCCARMATLGMLRPNPWRLSQPETFLQLPMHYAYASGGECRLEAAPGTDGKEQAEAQHAHCDTNPLGRGFTRHWYLDARKLEKVPAPRIIYQNRPMTAEHFWQGAAGKDLPAPAGLAPLGRGWQPRRALAGQFVEKNSWQTDEVPRLPEDFDFAYWNCAPADQQCAHLAGLEEFTLTNLCRHDHPSARTDHLGNTVLRFVLPEQIVFLLLADQNNQLLVLRLAIDTVVIDTQAGSVELVWRVLVPADMGQRAARLMQVQQPEQMARVALLEQAQEAAAEAAEATATAQP